MWRCGQITVVLPCTVLLSVVSVTRGQLWSKNMKWKKIFDYIFIFCYKTKGCPTKGLLGRFYSWARSVYVTHFLREEEKYQCVVASHMPPTGDLACNPGMCPDWESNQRPFNSQAGAQSTELHQQGLGCGFLNDSAIASPFIYHAGNSAWTPSTGLSLCNSIWIL